MAMGHEKRGHEKVEPEKGGREKRGHEKRSRQQGKGSLKKVSLSLSGTTSESRIAFSDDNYKQSRQTQKQMTAGKGKPNLSKAEESPSSHSGNPNLIFASSGNKNNPSPNTSVAEAGKSNHPTTPSASPLVANSSFQQRPATPPYDNWEDMAEAEGIRSPSNDAPENTPNTLKNSNS